MISANAGATELLLHLVAGVALLLWGVRMVRTGMTRAFGAALRRYLGRAMRNRFQAFLAGIGVTGIPAAVLTHSAPLGALVALATAGGILTASVMIGG